MKNIWGSLLVASIGLGAVAAQAESVPGGADTGRQSCATLGLAFSYSAIIVDENIATMKSRGKPYSSPEFIAPSERAATELRATSKALEVRYGKPGTAAEMAEAKALSEKRLQPMRDAAAICLR